MLLGYLAYDTAYSLLFFSLRSGAVMLAHHLVGIAGCAIGASGRAGRHDRSWQRTVQGENCLPLGPQWGRGGGGGREEVAASSSGKLRIPRMQACTATSWRCLAWP